ncbi:F0F1 ATP synthase subunit C [bacterium]|jgi:F-type H+-transporting ATPase subunit c|nr:F0F1 ATP synthase subunit C [bacterium]MBD62422.1 F0F1 ATP synthase subunit C [bacterium]MBT01705.1 F0F1 ATP synthase subunit C [bacterium]|tara:strand:- start:1211 stop:1453 length:243 start_codon:yes stop_codon:yes gene_type:complete
MIFGDGVNIDFLAIALAFAVPAAAAAMSQGKAISAAWDGMARQPEVSDSIGGKLVIALAFPEALGIFGLLLAIMLMGKLS